MEREMNESTSDVGAVSSVGLDNETTQDYRYGQQSNQNEDIQQTVKTDDLLLTELPVDILFLILRKLDVRTLGRLNQVCKFFSSLVDEDCAWISYSKTRTLVIPKIKPPRYKRGHDRTDDCSLREKCRLSVNWQEPHFQLSVLIHHKVKQIPWLQYDEDHYLWLSTDNCIRRYHVNPNGCVKEDHTLKLCAQTPCDITRFVVRDDIVVSGNREGSVWGWNRDTGARLFGYRTHKDDARCVDVYDGLVVSGSGDRTVQIVNINPDNGQVGEVRACFPTADRVCSVAMAPDGRTFASGTAANCDAAAALCLWDLDRLTKLCDLDNGLQRGAGMFDIKYETPQILLSCGYDSYLRMWDTRSQSCVSKWEEPFDYAVYRFQSDGHMSIFTGTARHAMVRLWDKRNTKSPVQLYFSGKRDSPVYSLAFDTSHLFAALDISVNLLDFSGYYRH